MKPRGKAGRTGPHDSKLRQRWAVLVIAVFLELIATFDAQSQEMSSATNGAAPVQAVPPGKRTGFLWHVELKRQFTERGTPEESSRTTLRVEATPQSFVSLVRLDLPFVDEKNGNPTSPRLGDIKLKLVSRSIPLGGTRLNPLFETTFPTADPESLGNGKYQLAPGAELRVPLWAFGQERGRATWKVNSKFLVQQVVSVAGDEARQDINYTKFEPELKAAWREKLTLQLTPKLVFDWHLGGEAGAVLELEGGWSFSRRWRTTLTLGHGLWNTDLPTMYGKKVEWTLRFNF